LDVGDGDIPVVDTFDPEKVKLREVETHKKEYGWTKPDWATPRGDRTSFNDGNGEQLSSSEVNDTHMVPSSNARSPGEEDREECSGSENEETGRRTHSRGANTESSEVANRRLKVGDGDVPNVNPFEGEEIYLREAETENREFSWTKPDWATVTDGRRSFSSEGHGMHSIGEHDDFDPSMHSSPGGNVRRLTFANAESPRGASVVLRESEIVKSGVDWEKPEWVHRSPLRKSSLAALSRDTAELLIFPVDGMESPDHSEQDMEGRRRHTLATPKKGIATRLTVDVDDPETEWEEIQLRNSEIQKREMERIIPDWARTSPLRTTSKGKVLAGRGDLSRTVSQVKKSVPFTPEWVMDSPLKKKNSKNIQATAPGVPTAMPFL
jgi:hypothetical protein